MNRIGILTAAVATLVIAGCGRINNVLLGEVDAKLGSHEVLVTDCYRTRVPRPSSSGDRFNWQPCTDAKIVIEAEQLSVNGKAYGKLNFGDSVLVDHGAVSVHAGPMHGSVHL